jgi:pyrophosphate--fructose-6-phosphate 1-phosphotransferase
LDGIVVIGGDDSNTNACLLAENFRFGMFCYGLFNMILELTTFIVCLQFCLLILSSLQFLRGKNMKTRVIGCPKTIDGDLKCKEVPTSFGFDTACKVINVFTLISTSLPFCLF